MIARTVRRALFVAAALALLASVAGAQGPPPGKARECGDDVPGPLGAALLAQQDAHAYELPAWRLEALKRDRSGPTSVQYFLRVPLTIHIVRLANGTGGMSLSRVTACIDAANAQYAAAGIQFFQLGVTRFIDNSFSHDSTNTSARVNALRQVDVVPNTINTYFTCKLADDSGTLCGKSSFTPDAIQGIVYDTTCTAPEYPSTFSHELGHYLDLYHTHETVFGTSCPNGSNCSTTGDLLCDTPADPNVSRPTWLSNCAYVGDTTLCGQVCTPDPTNLMSYGADCRTHFTGGQMNRALATLINLRSNLIQSPGLGVVWLDFNASAGSGTYASPYNSFAAASAAVATGGTIVIKSSNSNVKPTVTKAMTIDSFRGPSALGN